MMTNPLTPDRRLLRYMGAKNKVASWIISYFPEHETYVEPFAGSLAILYNKPRSTHEIVGDTNSNIVNFFKVLRDRPDELINQISLTPYAQDEFIQTEILFDPDAELSELERARLFYVWSWMSFYPHTSRARQPFRWTKGGSNGGDFTDLTPLEFMASRLRGVQILNEPAGEVIAKILKGNKKNIDKTLVYCDPPYLPKTRSDKKGNYSHEMSVRDHKDFCRLVKQLPMVIVSAYENRLYNAAFHDWTTVQKNTTKMARDEDGNAVKAVETLYISPGCGIYISEQKDMFTLDNPDDHKQD